jgi:hypothetical protein
LDLALQWVAYTCADRALAKDIESSKSRIDELVTAVRGLSYLDKCFDVSAHDHSELQVLHPAPRLSTLVDHEHLAHEPQGVDEVAPFGESELRGSVGGSGDRRIGPQQYNRLADVDC